MTESRYKEVVAMVCDGHRVMVRVKDWKDIVDKCTCEHGKFFDKITGVNFNSYMMDMCGNTYYINSEAAICTRHIYIEDNSGLAVWHFVPEWLDEVPCFIENNIDMCDEILV